MQHTLQMLFGFIRDLVSLLGQIVQTVEHVIGEIWRQTGHHLSTIIGSLGGGHHPLLLLGRQAFAMPSWGVVALALTGFILLLRYSQLRPSSARVDIFLSALVGIIGITLLRLLD